MPFGWNLFKHPRGCNRDDNSDETQVNEICHTHLRLRKSDHKYLRDKRSDYNLLRRLVIFAWNKKKKHCVSYVIYSYNPIIMLNYCRIKFRSGRMAFGSH